MQLKLAFLMQTRHMLIHAPRTAIPHPSDKLDLGQGHWHQHKGKGKVLPVSIQGPPRWGPQARLVHVCSDPRVSGRGQAVAGHMDPQQVARLAILQLSTLQLATLQLPIPGLSVTSGCGRSWQRRKRQLQWLRVVLTRSLAARQCQLEVSWMLMELLLQLLVWALGL